MLEDEPEAPLDEAESDTFESESELEVEDELPELTADFDEETLLEDEPEAPVEAAENDTLESEPALEIEDELPELNADFDEETLLEDEPELEIEEALPELNDEDDLETLLSEPQTESELPEVNEAEIEKEFMADFTQADFDALLSELDDPSDFDAGNAEDFEVDFDSLLQDELVAGEAEALPTDAEGSEDYLEIEDLLEQSDDLDSDVEPYVGANMDVGLGDFEELLAGENTTDVDLEDEGFAAKLDLAKAYIEIQDYDSAISTLNDVIENGPDSVQAEAKSLKSSLTES
ncbi:hypothetical protein CKO50_10825 [Pseudoalteromonas sp. HM-SA03]|uniref:FimV/HubP family polar landmark protein n=1 Tax=Pseudoalteromonas sp. HM-SA03 TaxID=2029678 RepID=UPI000BAE4C34|nr:FimV/HubP family polar landmark protein [Pseudoalteromonas sp. HM-SA03]PAY01214.1 hypothetical protein CKO50_10825 [Pseudoalteromonas sp. HM-SA03]